MSGVSETRKWHGRTYCLFDFCPSEEDTRREVQALHENGYAARKTACSGDLKGYHIWACYKEIKGLKSVLKE